MIIVAGGKQDFETNIANNICEYLDKKNYSYEYIKQASDFGYEEIESQLEKCKIFLILIGSELDGSTWLNHCLHYVWMLNQQRIDNKPRLIGYYLPGYKFPNCSKHMKQDIEVIHDVKEI